MQIIRKSLNLLLISIFLSAFLASANALDSSQKARSILEKTFKKYDALFSENMKGISSATVKMSVKGQGRLDPKATSTPSLLMDANIELYAVQPNKMFLNITGNMGNIQIVIPGKKPITAMMILPIAKQFTTMPVPDKTFRGLQPQSREKFWQDNILSYDGIKTIKNLKAHKITIKSKNPKLKETQVVYILDQKWDPIRYEVDDPVSGNTVVNFDEIKINSFIPPDKFVPKTNGFTQISKEQFMGAVVMQIVTSTMQSNQPK